MRQASALSDSGIIACAASDTDDLNFLFTFAPEAERAELTRGLGRDYEILRASKLDLSMLNPHVPQPT